MTHLTIKDLSVTADLDHSAMANVRGGTYKGWLPQWSPTYHLPNTSIKADQLIGQTQDVVNNNGNNVAFAHGITSTVNPTQSANNSISF